MSSDDLPGDVMFALSPSALAAAPFWVQYYLKLACDLTAPGAISSYQDFLVPSGSVALQYELQNVATSRLLTDARTPPISVFSTPTFTLPGTSGPKVTFDMLTRAVIIPEELISSAVTLSDLFADSDGLQGVQAPIQFSQAFAFTVQLNNLVTRAYWRVRPVLALIVAASGTDILAGGNTQSVVSADAQLGTDFCGLNRPDLAGVWALVDVGTGSGARSEPDQLVDAGAWVNGGGSMSVIFNTSIANAFDPLLSVLFQELVTNYTTDIAALQEDLLPSGAGAGRAAAIPDGSGGFAVPMRNRFVIGGDPLTSHALIFCAVTITEPYMPLVAFGAFPAYTDRAAALTDTSAVGGAYLEPIAVPGFVLDPINGDALMYHFPAVPISTAGYICGDAALIGANLTEAHAAVVAIRPVADAVCQTLLTPASRRRLLATSTPIVGNSLQKSPARTPVRNARVGVRFLTTPDPHTSPPPPRATRTPPARAPPRASPPLAAAAGRSFSAPPPLPPPPHMGSASEAHLSMAALVAATVVPACLLCVVCVGLFVVYRRRRRGGRATMETKQPQFMRL